METEFLSTKSLTVSSKEPNGKITGQYILAGNDGCNKYRSYLYFDLSNLPCNVKILSAELSLYLVENYCVSKSNSVYIYGLKSDFGIFTSFNKQPLYDENYIIKEFKGIKSGQLDIGISPLFLKWRRGMIINKGIYIQGREGVKSIAAFGSAYNKNYDLIPKIKVRYLVSSGGTVNMGEFIDVKYWSKTINFFGNYTTEDIIDVSKIVEGTFFIKNTGLKSVTISVEVSGDGEIWVKDTTKILESGNEKVFIPMYYGQFYRLNLQCDGHGSLEVYFIYQVYK
ncbi:hypothetical protein Q428_02430 [Fervidicella metallireducens AeB]|uniref:DUF6385 domain-containing protein n=1 Tax=Fervidicella metallireducens AeB TaxID=1403537 RepID=A0A017RXK8_9CLOT|nr:DNRLRE domain-containing protein [Fervidicella metallireducens]EYE89498.1 hypothetical protein Q428_02430 [Fervidicella metallireducens AeB]